MPVRPRNTRNALFIWIPRTGGTTISRWLVHATGLRAYTQYPGKRSRLYHTFEQLGVVTFGHTCINSLLHAGFVSRDYYDSAWKFSIVRHPVDRLISHAVRWHVKLGKYQIHVPIDKILDDICVVLDSDGVPPIGLWNSASKGVPYISSGLNPMWRWLCRNRQVRFADTVYRFGDMEHVAKQIAHRLGVPAPQQVQRRNATQRRKDYLTPNQLAIIEKYYADDLTIFGYKSWNTTTYSKPVSGRSEPSKG
jgi:hypothetical protein